jgi:hypothetical protein
MIKFLNVNFNLLTSVLLSWLAVAGRLTNWFQSSFGRVALVIIYEVVGSSDPFFSIVFLRSSVSGKCVDCRDWR